MLKRILKSHACKQAIGFVLSVTISLGFIGFIGSVGALAAETSGTSTISEIYVGGDVVFSVDAGKECAGKPTSILIYSGHNYTAGSNENIIYFDQGKSGSDGSYSFTVQKSALTDKYTVQTSVVGETGVSVLKSEKPSGAYEDFSDYTGGIPNGFEVTNQKFNSALTAQTIDPEHGTSMVIQDSSKVLSYDGSVDIYRYFDENMSKDRVIRMGFSFYSKDATNALSYIRLLDSRFTAQNIENDPYMWECVNIRTVTGDDGNAVGKIGYYGGTQGWSIGNICDYLANQWYDVEMWLDAPHERLVYYIRHDGEIIGEAETDFELKYDLKGILLKFGKGCDTVFDNFYVEYMDWDKRNVLINSGDKVPEGLELPCEVSVTSNDHPGNIFFGGEAAKLDFNITNLSFSENTFNIGLSVKDKTGSEVYGKTLTKTIGGNTTETIELIPELEKYGLYTVDVLLDNEVIYTAEASRCVKVDYTDMGVGVCAHYDRKGGDPIDTVDLATAAGIGSIRADWGRHEDEDGSFVDNFKIDDRFSAYISESDKTGVQKLALIGVNSSKYPDDDGGLYTSDLALQKLEKWCEDFARTYKDSIEYIEVGNEIDYKLNNDKTQISPEDYYKTLKAAYTGIKNGNPNAKVLLSSIYVTYDNRTANGIYYKCMDWLKELLDIMKNEGKYYFDIVATHPYFVAGNPESVDKWSNSLSWITKSKRIKDALSEYGLTSGENKKELWATELGYFTAEPNTGQSKTEEEAAAFMTRMLMLNDMYGFYDRMYFYCLYNEGTDVTYSEHNYGLLNTWKKVSTPLAAKEPYLAIAFRNQIMRGAEFVGTSPEISTGMDNRLYTADFEGGTRKVKVVWNVGTIGTGYLNVKRNTTETIDLGGGTVYQYDMYGNLTNTYNNQDTVTLTVGQDPIYFVSDSAEITVMSDGNAVTGVKAFESYKSADFTYTGINGANGALVVAQYKGGMLVDIKTDDITNGSGSLKADCAEGCDKVTVMVFDSFESIQPLSEVKVLK